MNHILLQLDKPQLITVIHSLCAKANISIRTGLDPGDGKPRVFADNWNLGTFTLLNLDAPLAITYRVTCVSTEHRRLVFEVDAENERQAIDFAAQRYDSTTDLIIEPITDEFLGTEREDTWTAEPIK
jgi:hypothetical protein